jgi:hypothetical protein
MAHGDRAETAGEVTWVLADVKVAPLLHHHHYLPSMHPFNFLAQVTQAKVKGALPVGHILKIDKLAAGGFANLQFEQEDLRKDKTFKGDCVIIFSEL